MKVKTETVNFKTLPSKNTLILGWYIGVALGWCKIFQIKPIFWTSRNVVRNCILVYFSIFHLCNSFYTRNHRNFNSTVNEFKK